MASPTRSWAGEGRTTTSTTECTMLVSELQGWRRMGSTRWPNMLTRSKILRWKDFCKLADEGSAHIMSHKFALFWQCIYGGSSATNGFLTDQMNYQEDKCRIRIVCLVDNLMKIAFEPDNSHEQAQCPWLQHLKRILMKLPLTWHYNSSNIVLTLKGIKYKHERSIKSLNMSECC